MPNSRRPAACYALAAALAVSLASRDAEAATHTWTWGPLDGEGYVQSDGSLVPFASSGGSLAIQYDPDTAPSGATATVSPGDAPTGVPPVTAFSGLSWGTDFTEPVLYGLTSTGAQLQVHFDGPIGPVAYNVNNWPVSLDGLYGRPVLAEVSASASGLPYAYNLSGPTAVVPEPSGLLLLAVGLGGSMSWSSISIARRSRATRAPVSSS